MLGISVIQIIWKKSEDSRIISILFSFYLFKKYITIDVGKNKRLTKQLNSAFDVNVLILFTWLF